MKLTSRGEYALLALVYLARQLPEQYVRVDAIATAQGIPPQFLEQILLPLKRNGLLMSAKGQHGGYRLAKAPTEITLADIIRQVDGPLAPSESVSKNFYRSTPIEKEPRLVDVLTEVRDCILAILENKTLADLITA